MKTQYRHTAFTRKSFNFFRIIGGCSILVALSASLNADAHLMVHSWQNRTGSGPGFSLMPKITQFSTSQNFVSTREVFQLPSNASLNRTYFDVNVSYGFTENLFAFGRLSALYTSVMGNGLNSQNLNTFGMNDQMVGAAWRAVSLENGTSVNLQAEVTIPAYLNSNALLDGSLFMGDETIDMTFGAFAEIPVSQGVNHLLYLDGGAGYTYRSLGYSALIPWNVQLKRYPIQEGMLFSAGARGTIPLTASNASLSQLDSDRSRGAAGSFVVGSFNPEIVLGQASIGYQDKSHIQYTLSGAIPITASNAADGIQVSFGVQIDLVPSEVKNPTKKPSSSTKGRFVEYDLVANITSVNEQLYLLKIDMGAESGVSVGQLFDIFDASGVVAKAKVTNVKSEESALRVIEYLKEKTIETNAIAKRVAKPE